MLYDVAVVGCGAAGLAALARVTRAGLRAVGLEAAERLGGRVRTVQLGGAVELGAEWIHGETDNAVMELARKHKVPTSRDTIALDCRRSDGAAPDRALCDELLACCAAARDRAEPSDRPLGEYVTEKYNEYVSSRPELAGEPELCGAVLSLARLLSANYDGGNWGEISAGGSAQYEELPGHQHGSFGARGYGTLVALLQAEAPAPPEVRLRARVVRVEARGGRVLLRCADGARVEARAAIVTVSLGVLKECHRAMFSPPLPARAAAAVAALPMGAVGKVCLRYERAWWPRERKFCGFLWRERERAQVEPWMAQILGFSLPSGSDSVITLWTSGDTAEQVEVMPAEELLSGCKRLLQMFMGPAVTVPDAVEMVRSAWCSSPLTRGSYSHRGLAAERAAAACADLAAPILGAGGRSLLLLAGEACSERHYSTVHGAIESGERAAGAVVDYVARATERRSKI